MADGLRVTALAGGVGGAKLAEGLAYLLPPAQLRIIVNTGDDFEHLGLTLCPDLDTVMYTLAGIASSETGWGIEGDSFHCLAGLERLDGPAWFRVGDRDLATHLLRTEWLRQGARLTEVTRRLSTTLGVSHSLLPMSDRPCRTIVVTPDGELPFQTYFVKRKARPQLMGVRWDATMGIGATPEVMAALAWADVIILCPSNPFVSIDPILALHGVRDTLKESHVIGVSPIIGGEAVKGPAAKMLQELEGEASAAAVATHFQDVLTGFVIDCVDSGLAPRIRDLGIDVEVSETLMPGLDERVALAGRVLAFGSALRG